MSDDTNSHRGIFLAMHYTPHADLAFLSVEHIILLFIPDELVSAISMVFVVVAVFGLRFGNVLPGQQPSINALPCPETLSNSHLQRPGLVTLACLRMDYHRMPRDEGSWARPQVPRFESAFKWQL